MAISTIISSVKCKLENADQWLMAASKPKRELIGSILLFCITSMGVAIMLLGDSVMSDLTGTSCSNAIWFFYIILSVMFGWLGLRALFDIATDDNMCEGE